MLGNRQHNLMHSAMVSFLRMKIRESSWTSTRVCQNHIVCSKAAPFNFRSVTHTRGIHVKAINELHAVLDYILTQS
jgi:hypothetical protein